MRPVDVFDNADLAGTVGPDRDATKVNARMRGFEQSARTPSELDAGQVAVGGHAGPDRPPDRASWRARADR